VLDYRCGGNRRVLMVAITGTLGSGWVVTVRMSRRRRVHAGGFAGVARSGSSHDNRVRRAESSGGGDVPEDAEMGGDKVSTLLSAAAAAAVSGRRQRDSSSDAHARRDELEGEGWDSQRVLRRMRAVESRATCG
jgi:hypothetical protein